MTLRDLRTRAGLSQRQLARLAGVGSHSVSRWEAGVRSPRVTNLIRLSVVLGVSVQDVYDAAMGGEAT